MITPPAPEYLLEMLDGVLTLLLAIMATFTCLHLLLLWRRCRRAMPQNGIWRCVRGIYYERKPEVAVAVLTVALTCRFGNFWHYRHLTNHHRPLDLWAHSATLIFVASTIATVVAILCWIRNVSPFRIVNWEWVVVVLSVLLFSAWLAS